MTADVPQMDEIVTSTGPASPAGTATFISELLIAAQPEAAGDVATILSER